MAHVSGMSDAWVRCWAACWAAASMLHRTLAAMHACGKPPHLAAGCFMSLAVHHSVCRQLRATEPGERLFLSVGCSHPGVRTWLGLDATLCACFTVLHCTHTPVRCWPVLASAQAAAALEKRCAPLNRRARPLLPDSVPTPLRCLRHERLISCCTPVPQSTATTSWPPLTRGPPPSRTCPTRRPACARCGGAFTRGVQGRAEESCCVTCCVAAFN